MARTPRNAPPDEKVTINLGPVDLGRVDLLVEEGFYASRTDLARTAIRRLVDEHRPSLDEAVTRRELTVGFVQHDCASLQKVRRTGERLDVRVIGAVQISADVTPELADETIDRLWVLGSLRAPQPVIDRLGAKISRKRGAP